MTSSPKTSSLIPHPSSHHNLVSTFSPTNPLNPHCMQLSCLSTIIYPPSFLKISAMHYAHAYNQPIIFSITKEVNTVSWYVFITVDHILSNIVFISSSPHLIPPTHPPFFMRHPIYSFLLPLIPSSHHPASLHPLDLGSKWTSQHRSKSLHPTAHISMIFPQSPQICPPNSLTSPLHRAPLHGRLSPSRSRNRPH
jgi:hypothetical protein